MVKYDPDIIREFANKLCEQAGAAVLTSTVIGGSIGGSIGAVASGTFVAIIGLALGGGIGYYVGAQKVFGLKLLAQQALCQIEIEQNTRKPT